ncbi:MAG TPA: serine/threonine-protein kinase [Gemmatimonadales bacterium]|jgi:serine/threonine-protein kinase
MPDAIAPEFVALQQAVAGRYSLERELGRGGMGIVFLARDVALDRLVAIKLLPPAQAVQAGLKERFLREARTAAQLSHPNIVPIYLVEEAAGLVFFVMAYVEGDTLGGRLRAKGPLAPAAGIRVLQEVAWALAYAHLRGIIHRDVKPDNILIEAGTGRAMVSDFGIARAGETSGGTSVGEILGTAQYMSPEQACGEKIDGRSDIYSLGIVGFYAFSGRLPFDAPDVPALLAMQITRPAPPLAAAAPGVPAKVAQAIDKCLAKNPDDRFATGEAFAEALAQATAVSKETPAAIRVWLQKGEGIRRVLTGWTALMGLAAVVDAAKLIMGNSGASISGKIGAIAVPWAIFLLYRMYNAQQVFSAGYTPDDMRAALRQLIEQRQEELAFEYDRDPPLWARIVRWSSFAALGAGAATVGWLWLPGHPLPDPGSFAAVMGGVCAIAFGGALIGRMVPGKRLQARDSTLEYRLKFLDSRVGRYLHKLATIGLKPRALPAGSHRPTEVAIGMAADQIFASLPKDQRKTLKDLPGLVRRLEAEAKLMRARAEELQAMIAGLGDEALSALSETLKDSQAAVVVGDQRDQLRKDLTTQRDRASQRLAVSVAALENIRLDLLRLKAGVGTVDQLTADLDAARDLQQEIELAVAANREVEAALRPT